MQFDGPCLCGEPPDPAEPRKTIQGSDGREIVVSIYRCRRCGRWRGGVLLPDEQDSDAAHLRGLLRERPRLTDQIDAVARCIQDQRPYADDPDPPEVIHRDLLDSLARLDRWITAAEDDLRSEQR